MSEFLTTSEVAELLRIKERKVYDLAANGTLPCNRAIGKLLFPRAEIEAWLAGTKQASSASTNASSGHAPRPDVISGSHDPLLDWAIRQSQCGMATLFDSSRDGLDRFAANGSAATGLHIPDAKGDGWNVDEVSRTFAGLDCVMIEFARRTRGLVLREELAGKISSLGDLPGHTLQPRQAQAGSQVLFDKLLAEAKVEPSTISLLEPVRSEMDVVQTVASGEADAGFALASIAKDFRLDFVPLVTERFDLLVDRRSFFEPPFQKLLAFCRSAAFAKKAADLGSYDVEAFGTVRFNG